MTLRKVLLAATILALPLAAQAQPVTGLYVAGALGANRTSDFSGRMSHPTIGNGATGWSIDTTTGWVGVVSAGWGFGNGLRLEGEFSYRSNDTDNGAARSLSTGARFPAQPTTGSITNTALMANVLYDIGSTMGWPVHITLGAGVGYSWHRWQGVGGNTVVGIENYRISDTVGAFAYQGILGLTLPIRAVPGLALTAEYRYFATDSHTMRGRYAFLSTTVPLSARADNQNHSALIGVRYNFGQAPRAVQPLSRVPFDPSFIVFFDFDRADLTPRARDIISRAARASHSQQTTRVEVTGHADRSGTPQYNQGLSQRRANNVASELVRLGVPRQAISVAAFGESRPLVPTADGVREPQNRRVEIVLR